MVIPIVVGVLGMVPKGLEKRLEELEPPDHSIVKINKNIWKIIETWGYCHLDFNEKFPVNTGMKHSMKCKIISLINKKNLSFCGFCHSSRPQSKKKKNKTNTWRLKKLWNMNMTVIPIVYGALGMVPKGLEKRLRELKIIGRIKTKVLLRSAIILRKVLETWGDLLSLSLQWKTTS